MKLSDGNNDFYVGKITKIIPNGGISIYKNWPTIQVQWYYRKKDIYLSNLSYKEDLSENEIFLSNHFENIIIESIISKCTIVSIDKYDLGGNHDETFFTRAIYNKKTKKLNPRINKWPKVCECKRLFNPDKLHIKCSKCERLFHPACVGKVEKETEAVELFACKGCKH